MFIIKTKEDIMLLYLLSISDESDHGKITYLYENFYDYLLKYSVKTFQYHRRPNYVFDAEDAVQNTFLKITKHIKKIDFSVGKKRLKNYLFAILTNEIINILRDNSDILELDEEISPNSAYIFIDRLEIKERYSDVVKAIEKLDDKYSTTLLLVYSEEKTVKEIAEMMGISPKTVYTRLERGRRLLLESLEGADIYGKN